MWRYTPTSNSLTLCFTRLWMIISVGTKSTSPQASRSSHVTKHTPLQDTIAHIPDHHPPFFPLHTLAPTTINNRTAPPHPTVANHMWRNPSTYATHYTQSHQILMPLLLGFMLRSQSKKSFRLGNVTSSAKTFKERVWYSQKISRKTNNFTRRKTNHTRRYEFGILSKDICVFSFEFAGWYSIRSF